ncbi:hypothetical protein [Xanthobacter autotrophicus]|uniref:hypothetical protein n=1 Tax=Xanthobacter autotrophicus TaxID=280 RepID=UPI00372C4118
MSGPADFIYLFDALSLALDRGYSRRDAEQLLKREISHGQFAGGHSLGSCLLLPTDPPIDATAGLTWKTAPKLNFDTSEIEIPTRYPDRRLPAGQRLLQARKIRITERNRVEWCAIQISAKDVARVFPNIAEDQVLALEERCIPRGVRTNTEKRAEDDCRTWIVECARTNNRPKKDDLRAAAIEKFAPHLSGEAFDRAWADKAPAAWKRRGRPKKAGQD